MSIIDSQQILKIATLHFSHKNSVNLAHVIPAMDRIDCEFATSSTAEKFHKAICAALAVAKKTLNRYYTRTDLSEVYRIAMGALIIDNFSLLTYVLSSSSEI